MRRLGSARLYLLVLFLIIVGGCAERPRPDEIVPPLERSQLEPRVAAAIARAESEVESTLESAPAWGRLGMTFQAHALYPQAVACYERAEALDQTDYRWPYLAALALGGDDVDRALERFRRAAERAEREEVLLAWGDALAARGASEEAESVYQRALTLVPGSSLARLGLARLAIARGEGAAAEELLRAAVAHSPKLGEAHRLLATLYRQRGDSAREARHELAARAFAGARRPADPAREEMEETAASSRSLTERGRRLAAAGDYKRAERFFREVFELRPANPRDLTNLGGALAGQERLEEAIGFYRQALELDPDDAVAHNNLGLALAGQGRLDEGAAALERAIAADPEYAEAVHNLGLLEARSGQPEDAVAKFRHALELDPGLMAARTDLAVALERLGRRDQAIEALATAVDLDPHDPAPRYALALTLIQAGRHDDALVHLQRGLELAPNSSRFASLLAWELATAPEATSRDATTAMKLARRVRDAYPQEPSALDVLAAALAERGDFPAAAETAAEAARLAAESGRSELAAEIGERLELYRAGRAFRQPRPGGSQPEPGSKRR